MTGQPSVSVVIPAYRCEKTICCAIDSALEQQVPLEIIIIDDDPGQPLVLPKSYANNPIIRVLRNKENLGAAQSRNIGVEAANAPYIAFLDSDDLWLPGKLQKQLDVLKTTGAVLCCTGRELMTPDGAPTGKVIGVKEKITYRELLKHNSINCSSVLIRRDVALEFPMTHADSHEDYIMWLRILQKYDYACGINEPLLRYRLSTTGKSGNKLHSAKMTYSVYRYMGFGFFKSLLCFCSYALHGVRKYLFTEKRSD